MEETEQISRKDVEQILSQLEENLRLKEDCQLFADHYNLPLSKFEKYAEKSFDLVMDAIINGFDISKVEIPENRIEAFALGYFLGRRLTDLLSYLAFNITINQIFSEEINKPESE